MVDGVDVLEGPRVVQQTVAPVEEHLEGGGGARRKKAGGEGGVGGRERYFIKLVE